jgi:oxygen-independent coproporphyrinogen-3 oxidase
MENISVYVHIPYCPGKCHYCDFLSFPSCQALLSPEEYVSLLEKELELHSRTLMAGDYCVTTLYIGGGTPTVLPVPQLHRLLAACKRCLPLYTPEWTVEANPGTVSEEIISILANHGVTRVSIGVQDLDDTRLAMLGRMHNAEQAKQAVSLCRQYFPSVSMDLMAGLPGQSAAHLLSTMDTALQWYPDHISLYSLRLEEGTPLAGLVSAGALMLPDEDEVAAMLLAAKKVLASRGFIHYEIANFSKPGHTCRHNITYWENRPYLGVGLGAHSYWQGSRLVNTSQFLQYAKLLTENLLPVTETNPVSQRQSMEDTMILGLRMFTGVSFPAFQERFGQDARKIFGRELKRLEAMGLIRCDGRSVCLTHYGYLLANLVFQEFIGLES